jgi:ketosteroid isomerase-like protein
MTLAPLAFAVFAAAAADSTGKAPPRPDPAALAAQDARFAAMVAADVPRLAEMLDDSLTYHHSNGSVETRAEFLEAVRAGVLRYHALEVVERQVRRFGDIAIVTGVVRLRATNRGEALDVRLRFTDTYARRDARYRLVAWQSTRIP